MVSTSSTPPAYLSDTSLPHLSHTLHSPLMHTYRTPCTHPSCTPISHLMQTSHKSHAHLLSTSLTPPTHHSHMYHTPTNRPLAHLLHKSHTRLAHLLQPCRCVHTSTACVLTSFKSNLPIDTKSKSLACSEAKLLHERTPLPLQTFDVNFDNLADVVVLPWHMF